MSIDRVFCRAFPILPILLVLGCINPSSGGGSGSIKFPATTDQLNGTWFREMTRSENPGVPGTVTYHYAETWVISGTTWERTQAKTAFSDASSDSTNRSRGTITYRASDGVVAFAETDTWDDGDSDWVPSGVDDNPLTYRNFISNGKWVQDALIRIGSGSGLVGTWEATPRRDDSDEDGNKDVTAKTRYTFTSETVNSAAFATDSSGNITGSPYFTGTPAAYTAGADTFTVGSSVYVYLLISKNYLAFEEPDQAIRSFTKQ